MHDNAGPRARGLHECAGHRLGLGNREFTCSFSTDVPSPALHLYMTTGEPQPNPYLYIDRVRYARICLHPVSAAPWERLIGARMSSPASRTAQPPWTNSPTLGGEFINLPRTDEIALKNGDRYARPKHVPAKSLDGARFDGNLPFLYSGTPPGDGSSYLLDGRSRALSAPASHTAGVSLFNDRTHIRDGQGSLPSGSPSAAHNLDSALGPTMQMPGLEDALSKSTTSISAGRALPLAFYQGTPGQIDLKEPVRPGKSVRAVSAGNEHALLPLLPKLTQNQLQQSLGRGSLLEGIRSLKRNGKNSTRQKISDTKQDHGQNGPVQLPRFSKDIPVHFTGSSSGQSQQGNSAPGPGKSARAIPIGNNGVLLTMFPGFSGRERNQGDVGKIILMLCGEPDSGSSEAPMWTPGINLSSAGGRVYARVERYVIIHPGPPNEPFCIALPIKTYGGRGVSAPGIMKSHHCIIYSSPQPPVPLDRERPVSNEDGMRAPPIRVVLDDPTNLADRLDPASRVHLMGAKAIEDQDRTRDFGRVSQRSESALRHHFWTLWRRDRPLPRPPPPISEEESEDNEGEGEDDDNGDDDENNDDSDDGSNEEQQE